MKIPGGYPGPVTATRPDTARPGLLGQLSRFIAVGAISAVVDFGIYHVLVSLGLWVHAAKAISFICGTTTAYLLNRRFTFDSTGGRARLAGFMVLYGTTFALNVGVNALMLSVLPEATPMRLSVAWVIAQGTATVVNFVLLRTVVFRAPRP